jgi:hypothetical protein
LAFVEHCAQLRLQDLEDIGVDRYREAFQTSEPFNVYYSRPECDYNELPWQQGG